MGCICPYRMNGCLLFYGHILWTSRKYRNVNLKSRELYAYKDMMIPLCKLPTHILADNPLFRDRSFPIPLLFRLLCYARVDHKVFKKTILTKDVEPFLWKSAYELIWFKMVSKQANMLAEWQYWSFYWIEISRADPEPSRFARC